MGDTSIQNGSNISGVGLLLNLERVSNDVDIDEVENRVRSIFADVAIDEEIDEKEENILEKYQDAFNEIDSIMNDDQQDDLDDEDDAVSVKSTQSHHTVRSRRSVYNRIEQDSADTFYTQRTRDDRIQTSIQKVMQNVPNVNLDIDQEIEEERKSSLIEQIESIRDDLSELGINVDSYQYQVDYNDPIKRIEEVHRRLTFKFNKLKYTSIAEEMLIAGSSLLEMMFNGKHEYFGVKPDITGYSDVVKSKLKRIRPEVSNGVSRFVSKHNVGMGTRLAMELLPSLITQSQRRKLQNNDTISYKKESIRSHLSDLNNML
jgi:hypothetical protein